MNKLFYLRLGVGCIIVCFLAVVGTQARQVGGNFHMKTLTLKDTIPKLIIDNTLIRVHYDLTFVPDLKHPEITKNVPTLLQIGTKYSRFVDYNKLIIDSIAEYAARKGYEYEKKLKAVMPFRMKFAMANFEPILFKGYPSGKNTLRMAIPFSGTYEYSEAIPVIKWHLESGEDTTIQGYRCQKASCAYGGRKYIAWYTSEIAVSNGPYVFNGLPGLILTIADTKKEYVFEMNGLVKVQGYDPIYLKDKIKIIHSTRARVRKAYKNYCDNPAQVIMNSGGIIIAEKDASVLKSLKEIPYNPIELE